MIIGTVREVKDGEHRVCLTPPRTLEQEFAGADIAVSARPVRPIMTMATKTTIAATRVGFHAGSLRTQRDRTATAHMEPTSMAATATGKTMTVGMAGTAARPVNFRLSFQNRG